MGYYVNPEGESKETWLDRNGTVEMYTPIVTGKQIGRAHV